ncbi:MAG: glycosyltransferase [Hyphomicrobium sp.]|jgi:ceramide glucosyltransferase|nr:glycosyltransferase [Hyphomicrobium sp.]
MNAIASAALIFCALATATHLITAGLVIRRYRRTSSRNTHHQHSAIAEPITIIRPVCGVDHFDRETLRSTFALDDPNYEIIFCASHENDAATPVVRALMAEFPERRATLLIGDDRPTANPKLNNIVKGWNAARTKWIVLADSNVLMPPAYLDDLLDAYTPQTGLVCSPPIGSRPSGFAAEVECAFLNGYQARWQCAADAIGFGFAQGKSMLWKREVLDRAGGIIALGAEIAEDAAATKIVRAQGLNVRLVARPFEQPLGPRQLKLVWNRQVRWARLRRATFATFYIPELFAGSVAPIAAGVFAFETAGGNPVLAFVALLTVWYGTEAIVTRVAGWHMSRLSPWAWVMRDILQPVLWLQGWTGNTFTWRGNSMSVEDPSQPHATIAARA